MRATPKLIDDLQSCALMVKVQSVFHFLQYLPWAAFSGLRVYALNGQKWFLPTVVFLLSIVPMVVNFTQYHFGLSGSHDPIFGCLVQVSLTVGQAKACTSITSDGGSLVLNSSTVTIVSRVSLIVADTIVIIVTLATMHRRGLISHIESRRPLSLATVLLRDGVIYFVVLVILNVLHLTFTMLSFVIPFDPSSQVTTFTEPVTAVLVSRFLLDLQSTNRKSLRLDPSDSMHFDTSFGGTLSFARVVGSIGAPLEPTSIGSNTQYYDYDLDDGRDVDESAPEMRHQRDSVGAGEDTRVQA
ncbi:hypothetical protein ONZ51_g4865 [Trametes cubensis]|uniref:Transmembrane protein n=1 Tax=Trametes cubensis TaxID=1111947 RepID=A0AAD7X9X9_9APHY|nr:hypothetical protein ONZ51_g4865 [Trametes cubensis]